MDFLTQCSLACPAVGFLDCMSRMKAPWRESGVANCEFARRASRHILFKDKQCGIDAIMTRQELTVFSTLPLSLRIGA